MSDIETITTAEELELAVERSRRQPVLLFKHSLTCSISADALHELEGFAEDEARGADLWLGVIPIQRARSVSQLASNRTGVRHESPQAILLKAGRTVWHASHWGITRDALAQAVKA